MDRTERVHLRESCVVPYRETERGIEFCLVSDVSANRWEFPKTEVDADETSRDLLRRAAAGAGLAGQLEDADPLDSFVAARGKESRSVTAYLMRVTLVDDEWPKQETHRRLWCLAEEARARLRRKPFRRFIDRALHLVGAGGVTTDASRPSSIGLLPRKPR